MVATAVNPLFLDAVMNVTPGVKVTVSEVGEGKEG
jgi:hypothetical protein